MAAATGSVTIAANVSGLPAGSVSVGPLTVSLSNAVGEILPVTLASGANTITVPSGVTCVLVVPSSGTSYGGTITWKGVSGDTGVAVSTINPTLVSVASTVASFVLTASTTGATVSVAFF